MKNKSDNVKSIKNSEYENILNKADELIIQDKLDDALNVLMGIPRDCDEYCETLFMKSMIFAKQGREKKSFETFREFSIEEYRLIGGGIDDKYELSDADKFNDLFYYGLAMFFVLKDYRQTIKYCDLALKLEPNRDEVLFYKSLSFAFLGRLKRAVKIMNEAIKLNPDNPSYWHNKGTFYAELNFNKKAHDAFDRAISIKPDSDSWSCKGALYCRKNDFSNALACFDEAIKFNPKDINSIVYMGSVYSELKEYKKADECFSRAEKIDPYDTTYLAEKGKHFLNQNLFQKSIVYFDECLEIDDEIAVAWMYKAMALSALNLHDESERCAKKAVLLDPDSLDVLDGFVILED